MNRVWRPNTARAEVMRLFFALVMALGCTIALARPDRNAFLNQKATSVAQLINQARRDPEVMDRYRRHFAMTDREVVAYFSGLRLARLTAAGAYNVYSVPPGGYIKVHVQKLRLGTPVFADTFGNPILIVKCGNPLTQGPKSPQAHNDPDPVAKLRPRTEELRELGTEQQDFLEFGELVAMTPEDVAQPSEPNDEIVTTQQSPIPIIPAGGPIGGWLLGLLGGGLIIGGGGGDDGGGETVVPEPTTLGVIAVAGAGMLLRRRTRRVHR